jgi:hypothetical protein
MLNKGRPLEIFGRIISGKVQWFEVSLVQMFIVRRNIYSPNVYFIAENDNTC